MAERYPIFDMQPEQFKYADMKQSIEREKSINRFSRLSLWLFGGGLTALAVGVLIMRGSHINLLETLIGKSLSAVFLIGFVLFIFFNHEQHAIPRKRWKCPCCEKPLPFFVPAGRKAHIRNKFSFNKVVKQGIAVGKVKDSFLLVPEKCPYCGKSLVKRTEEGTSKIVDSAPL